MASVLNALAAVVNVVMKGNVMSAILATNQMVVIANKSVTMGANHAQRRRPIAQPALMAFSLAELAALTAITRV
jgi:hypothetical protein